MCYVNSLTDCGVWVCVIVNSLTSCGVWVCVIVNSLTSCGVWVCVIVNSLTSGVWCCAVLSSLSWIRCVKTKYNERLDKCIVFIQCNTKAGARKAHRVADMFFKDGHAKVGQKQEKHVSSEATASEEASKD
ncbi:hypothetical protein Btru_068424 [Bulinus truncatus]|nr:hypothetical protein Btru_068424 [Bulinus truncatus]